MQVSNTLNNIIRILFNPKIEAFKLFDFLVVKSEKDKYVAQIIEIYDDKFDASQNVAKLKLFYKISENNEVMPYDGFTPNKECEILKIKQEEIESFLNNNKETFEFGTNKKTNNPLNIQYDFFNNNAVIVADKVESANILSIALAKKLSSKKHSVIIDSTGIMEFEDAKKIKASKDFKMPLNFITIDYVFDKCLPDASLEFQAVCGEILNEIKKFAKKQPCEFIPFNSFLRVLLEQYKATPYTELKLLISRMKKFQMEEIFARSKKDCENLFKTITKNEITLIDLSGIETFWQKAFLEYITDGINDEVYLITRINDENCDIDLINNIYCKKKNITFVPNVSYNYKKLPSVVQYCKNYILMQSLYQRTDFLNANFALSNLITEDCILFGEDTGDFLYLAKDFELKIVEKKIEYRKIALSLLDEETENKVDTLEEKLNRKTESEKLLAELNDFADKQKEEHGEEDTPPVKKKEPLNENIQSVEDYFEDVVNNKEIADTAEDIEPEDNFEELSDNGSETSSMILSADKVENPEKENDTKDISAVEKEEKEPDEEIDIELNSNGANGVQELELSDDELDFFQMVKEEEKETPAENTESTENISEITIEEQEEPSEENDLSLSEIALMNEETLNTDNNEALQEKPAEIESESVNAEPVIELIDEDTDKTAEPVENVQKADVTEESLIDIELSSEDTEEQSAEPVMEELSAEAADVTTEPVIEVDNDTPLEDEDAIDLSEVANNSIESNFEDIINTKNENPSSNNDDKQEFDSNIIEVKEKDESLPIFKEELPKEAEDEETFKEGDIIRHKKYGKGTIIKTVQYEQRQFVQVEFETSGKILLDPKVADIKLEQ